GGMNSPLKTVINYVDLDPATPAIKDWNCGTATYDGHLGTDIEITDFYEMDEGIPILAAAPGSLVFTHDGEFDRRTAFVSGAPGNGVVVQHADGSQATYWHMRKNSVRPAVDAAVAIGDTLGMVGSSGYSTGPHLHFEVQDGGVADPFLGTCQPTSSRWLSQGAYV